VCVLQASAYPAAAACPAQVSPNSETPTLLVATPTLLEGTDTAMQLIGSKHLRPHIRRGIECFRMAYCRLFHIADRL
jgi:hypothetical protein